MNAALVPVRSISGSKSRLASTLSDERREALALAMLEDMLTALADSAELDRYAVVTSDPRLGGHAARLGAEVIDEGEPRGLNGAVEHAAETLAASGVDRLLVIPGDVPCLDAVEVDGMFSVDSERYPVVAAPSAALTGTNGLLVSPPGVIPFRFEGLSLEAFRRASHAAGAAMLTLALPSFAVDVDTPADLLTLAGGTTKTSTLVREWRDDLLRESARDDESARAS